MKRIGFFLLALALGVPSIYVIGYCVFCFLNC